MEKAIFDTSVWIDLFNDVTSPQTSYLLDSISLNADLVILTPTIIQEILQGVKSESDFKEKESVLLSFNCVEQDWKTASVEAAHLYFSLRKKEITIRKSADCLIAQSAIAKNYLLVHNDSDFDLIAKGSDLRIL